MAEASIWDREPDWRRRPPQWDVIDREDLLIWSGPVPERTTNEVVYARWPEDQVERGVVEALGFFRDRGIERFEWILGPSSQPAGLGGRLEARGLVRGDDARLMTARLPLPRFETNPSVEVVEVSDASGLRDYLAVAWPQWSDERVEAEVSARLEYLRSPSRRGGYLVAYLDGRLAGNATWRDSGDGRSVYLKGAGTLPEFRHRGVYSTLVARRCAAARSRGCDYAAIIAVAHSSAPILRARGFEDHGWLAVYVPPSHHRARSDASRR